MNVLGFSGLHNSVSFKRRAFPALPTRFYRIAQGFDAAAALVTNTVLRAAAEERFTGEKATGSFPVHAIRFCLEDAGVAPRDLDYVAHSFCYEPFAQDYSHDEYTRSLYEEVYSREAQIRRFEEFLPGFDWGARFVSVPHHLAHAASTFYLSGFPEALILVADGMGEAHSLTVARGRSNSIKVLDQLHATDSLGILYGLVTLHLGFEFGLDEYKVMGLAPYGRPDACFQKFMEFIRLESNGRFSIPLLALDKSLEDRETHACALDALAAAFGPPRDPGAPLTAKHRDVAAGLQSALQACLIHVLRHFRRLTGEARLCLAGGVTLNCSANGTIRRSRIFEDVFVQPASGDDGSALGAALYVRQAHEPAPRGRIAVPFWGPCFDQETVLSQLQAYPQCRVQPYDRFDALAAETASRLAAGEIVGWFQGRMEFGPRALGNRSILADPRDPGMRDRLNARVKKREEFRPFAPAVRTEDASRYFDTPAGEEQAYSAMLFVVPVRSACRTLLTAVTHVDGSARVQTVHRDDNPRFWALLSAFGGLTGIPVLLNTSFNVRGQPIVCTPRQAIETFLNAGLDALVIENCLVVRREGQGCRDEQ
jgi:carbamoyltransferase